MIRSLRFENFRSFQRATLPLSTLTLLVGPNASGKSNAREGVQVLSWIAQGRRLDEIMRSLREREIGVRGRFSDLGFRDAKRVGFEVVVSPYYDWSIDLAVDSAGLRVAAEALRSYESVPLFQVQQSASGLQHDIAIAYNNFKRGGKKPTIPGTDLQAVLTQLGTPAAFRHQDRRSMTVIPSAARHVSTALAQVVLLDPNPHAMRGESFVEDVVLRPDGANVSSVLFHLCQSSTGKDAILRFLKKLPERDIADIAFIESARQQVIVQVRETFIPGGELRDASLLSDGTLRVLAIAAAVLSAPEGALVVIEEIDNGVHPSRARLLLENMHRVAKERSLSLLITSHNPALADALPTEAIPDVVYCHRDPETGASVLTRLSDLEDYPRLVAQGPLGDLLTREVIDRFVKHPRTSEAKQEAARAWLASLGSEGAA